jgi:hypothetical protein
MVPEEQPVEYILDAIDGIMAPSSQPPKVLLFDIGGVCVSDDSSPHVSHGLSLSFWPSNFGAIRGLRNISPSELY